MQYQEQYQTPSEDSINSSEEPLMSVSEVMGWNVPEKVQQETLDEELYKQKKLNSRTAYQIWADDPTPDNLFNVVNQLKPTIQSVLASYGSSDPNIKSKARVITAKAVKSYNPESGASLPTWVSSQLRQIVRDIRKSNNSISLPENAQLEAYQIYRAQLDLEDELGREPTVEELADRSHMSIKKIQQIRKKVRPVASESSFDAEDGSSGIVNSNTDYTQDALDYIYNDSDLKDKQLLEHLLGYGGADVWDSNTIMSKLGLTSVQLSRRKMRLGKRIQQITSDLEKV